MSVLSALCPVHFARENYLGQKYYFLTLCTSQRQPFFVNAGLSTGLIELLRTESSATFFNVLACCLMPDHLQFLAERAEPACDLLHIVKSFKTKSSRQHSRESASPLWQTGFYEHIVRTTESAQSIAWYISLNPVRKGLAVNPKDYPFAGSFCYREMPWSPPWMRIQEEIAG
jgi:putative transposase